MGWIRVPRSFWFRLSERSGDDGSPLSHDLFRDPGEALGGARFFQHIARQSRSDPPSVSSELRLAATPIPTADSLVGFAPFTAAYHPAPTPAVSPVPTADPMAVLDEFGPAAEATPAPEAATASPGPDNVEEETGGRLANVQFGTTEPLRLSGTPANPFDGNGSANYVVAFSDHIDGGSTQDSFVWDANTMTLLTGGIGDWPELGAGDDDTLELSGDFSAGFILPGQPAGIDSVVLLDGSDYNLSTTDDHVALGDTMTINGMPLGAGNQVMFDGSAETDGRFEFFGSAGDDFFFGGAGDDRILGLLGADTLSGGGGSDIFVYTGASESSGADYDTIADFDPATDRIDLPGGVAGFAAAIEGGTLSTATFNDDLAAALANLGAAEAVWFAPDAGDLAGQIFLIVDGNDRPGYQEGEDFVFAIGGAPLTNLTGHTDIFI